MSKIDITVHMTEDEFECFKQFRDNKLALDFLIRAYFNFDKNQLLIHEVLQDNPLCMNPYRKIESMKTLKYTAEDDKYFYELIATKKQENK